MDSHSKVDALAASRNRGCQSGLAVSTARARGMCRLGMRLELEMRRGVNMCVPIQFPTLDPVALPSTRAGV
eukprot:11067678-Heterocapsa_arctica.AAC.1